MNFKDLKDVEIGTILVSMDGIERYFDGFNSKGNQIKAENIVCGNVMSWDEPQIENWTIKKPEPKCLGEIAWFINTQNDNDVSVGLKNSERYKLLSNFKYWREVHVEDGKVYELP